jgi:hypothetical protein
LYWGVISPGTNAHICTGWPDALYRFNTQYKWELWTGTNVYFSSSERTRNSDSRWKMYVTNCTKCSDDDHSYLSNSKHM